jgi:hypothetical protein
MEMCLHLFERRVAQDRGFTHYFTGRPCSKGHLRTRRASNKNCLGCISDRASRYREKTPGYKEARSAYDKARWEEKRDSLLAMAKIRYQKNKEKHLEYTRAHWSKNKEKYKGLNKIWRLNNAESVRLSSILRKKRTRQATPKWVNRSEISLIYKEAWRLSIETGIPHHVDHIVPLNGDNVCGLHVPWNLRPIPWLENLKKGKRLDFIVVTASLDDAEATPTLIS